VSSCRTRSRTPTRRTRSPAKGAVSSTCTTSAETCSHAWRNIVGNFGDGQINAYEETAAGFEHRGTLRDPSGQKLVIDGLWALEFGNAGMNGSPDTLFFTAGPNDESHGLFGTVTTG
jgi:uncharacterized protein (TIGR03118 family)